MTRDTPRHDRTGDVASEPVHHCDHGWMPGHTRDDDQPRRCLICHPQFLPENRRRRLWGGNPDARPRETQA
jgi:hypothetical protein